MKSNTRGFAQIIIFIVLLVLVGIGAYYFGTQKVGLLPNLVPTPRVSDEPITVVPITTPNPTAGWKSYQAPKTEFSKAFTLYYPPTWKLEFTQPSIRLSKGDVYFEFKQGPGSVGMCLFNDDKNNPDAPQFATIFPSYYKEIKKSESMTWRLATEESPKTWDDAYILCEKLTGDSYYSQYTSIGYVPFRVSPSDTSSLNEIVEILTSIKIAE